MIKHSKIICYHKNVKIDAALRKINANYVQRVDHNHQAYIKFVLLCTVKMITIMQLVYTYIVYVYL